jgi:hypothetical protein
MSRVWLGQATTLLALAGLGGWWWRDYSRHRRTGALLYVQRLRAWRLFGLVLFIAGLLLELAPIWTSFDAQAVLAAATVGLGGCTVIVTWLALAAHRRYPGLVPHVDARGQRRQGDREGK